MFTNPTFTGIPIAPTATVGTNTTQIATTEFVNTAIKNNSPQESHVYSELATMISNNQLIAGKQYILTDYVTKYKQPFTNLLKTISTSERLVLTANSSNTFEKICSSLDYPNDIIYYDFNNNKCEDNTTSRNGFILRRIDTIRAIRLPE